MCICLNFDSGGMCLYNWVITVAFAMHLFGIHFLMLLMCATRTQSDKKETETEREN